MNKLEVGMYVRTRKDGIGRIISFSACDDDECCFIKLSNRQTGIKEYNIIKASFNIIDLIEVGDYVNGGQVREIKEGYIRISGGKSLWAYIDNLKDIKSIVTKEQFESMEYKLGDSNE